MTCSFRSLSFALLVLAALSVGCRTATSRYRLDLYMTEDRGRKAADINGSKFVVASDFGVYDNQIELRKSASNTLILTASTNWKPTDRKTEEVLAFDKITRYDIYFNIPEPVTPGKIELKDNSVALLTGNYDRAPAQKLYYPEKGTLVIDSVSKSYIFATFNGSYRNIDKQPVSFDGKFKAKYR